MVKISEFLEHFITIRFQHMYKLLQTSSINLLNGGIFSKIVEFHRSFFHVKAKQVFFNFNGADRQNYPAPTKN